MDAKRLLALLKTILPETSTSGVRSGKGQENVERSAPRRCGARTRAGHPCQRKGTGAGGRCANHGGASTGPKSAEGRAKISSAQKARWKKWRADRRRNAPEV
ncbi:HGGxSTG domain-containing protein [Leptospira interrogans]